jgi:hypothetical protein
VKDQMMGADKGIVLTAPFTEITSLKGEQTKNKTCFGWRKRKR